jgi:thymidylate kinase
MLKPCIIVIAGTVGAGKSTQIKLLHAYFSKRGLKVHKTYIKGFHGLSYALAFFVAKILGNKRQSYPLRTIHESNRNLEKRLLKLLLLLDFIEVLFLNLFRVFVFLKLGYHIIVEEHIIGYVSNHLHYSTINPGFYTRYSSKMIKIYTLLLSSLFHVVFFLDAPDEELRKRWIKRGTPTELKSYLNSLRNASKLLEKCGVKIVHISTVYPKIEVFRCMVRELESAS